MVDNIITILFTKVFRQNLKIDSKVVPCNHYSEFTIISITQQMNIHLNRTFLMLDTTCFVTFISLCVVQLTRISLLCMLNAIGEMVKVHAQVL